MSGAVISDPLDASGLAPRISRWSVRSTSGTATLRFVPYIQADASCLGYWSTVEAEVMFFVPSALSRTRP